MDRLDVDAARAEWPGLLLRRGSDCVGPTRSAGEIAHWRARTHRLCWLHGGTAQPNRAGVGSRPSACNDASGVLGHPPGVPASAARPGTTRRAVSAVSGQAPQAGSSGATAASLAEL